MKENQWHFILLFDKSLLNTITFDIKSKFVLNKLEILTLQSFKCLTILYHKIFATQFQNSQDKEFFIIDFYFLLLS